MRNRPAYALSSVDNALRLLQLLRDQGFLRLKDAATQLEVAPSTAHRLMSMLVYRGFALQDESRCYLPGPSMGVGPAGLDWTRVLRDIAQNHLELLSNSTGETVSLMVRVGTQVRFLSSVESGQLLKVGSRQGTVLPAHRTSGGKAMLAELEPAIFEELYRTDRALDPDSALTDTEFHRLTRELRTVRRLGYAVNKQETEEAVVAYGVCVHDPAGRPLGAVSVSLPVSRDRPAGVETLVAKIRAAARIVDGEIAATGAFSPFAAE